MSIPAQGAVGAETRTAGQSLDLRDLHAANIARQAEWCPDQVPDLSFRGNELGGECGEALRACPNGRPIAEERVAAFLAHALRLPADEAVIERLNIEWCREAWRALQGASYADVVRHAQTFRPRKAA